MFRCSSRDSWIVEGFWLWIILLPSKSSAPDFKHSEKTFNRNWHRPNFLSISRSFFSFAFFFPSLSSSGSTVQPWITKPSPKFCGKKRNLAERPLQWLAHRGEREREGEWERVRERERHAHIDTLAHSPCRSNNNKEGWTKWKKLINERFWTKECWAGWEWVKKPAEEHSKEHKVCFS